MRIELAKMLLKNPDVLLLDEPTNHLDIDSIQWLEDFLVNNGKAVVVISHDRTFVDNITTRTIEVTMGRIYDYKVNYSQYLVLRQERRIQQLHTLDIKFLVERPALWTVVIWTLLLGGAVVSFTGIVLSVKYLKNRFIKFVKFIRFVK